MVRQASGGIAWGGVVTPFAAPIRPKDLDELFDLSDPQRAEPSMAYMQREGIAAIYNILCDGCVAYLADEVGMGKTYQALGLAALVWSEKPDARILFLSPRQNLQEKWVSDYTCFFKSNYRRRQEIGDDRVTSALFREPIHRPELFQNLRSWVATIGLPGRIAPFLRHTSFMRPVFIGSGDKEDLDALWRAVERQVKGWGLFNFERPATLTRENASLELNLAFARALNARLALEAGEGKRYFDLVIADEAQCLRNPGNQTNSVLHAILKDQVCKWLFMSATPAHRGPGDIPTTLNHYPNQGDIVPAALVSDPPAMQKVLQKFMVRRPRRYSARDETGGLQSVGKDVYRKHDDKTWAVEDADMSALSTLAMGLVQKGLVEVLQGRNNRYRVGFLSSFESLRSSIRGSESQAEWHEDQSASQRDDNAPDAMFIDGLARDFEEQFGMHLPHAKVDSVVDTIAPLAFGSDCEAGGQKFLIFARRVSTVEALRERLAERHRQAVEARISRCWNLSLGRNWDEPGVDEDDVVDDGDDPEASDAESDSKSPFRVAMAKGGWLNRYRQTFRRSRRNALFFEDGWLERLCRAGNRDPKDAAACLPDELWAESWTHAARAAGGSGQFRAHRLRYLAVHGVRRHPGVFGLDETTAKPWREAYEVCLRNHLAHESDADPHADLHKDDDLFDWPTLWARWDRKFADTSLALPGSQLAAITSEDLCKRQVARTILGQVFRLTDTLLDLYCADQEGRKSNGKLAHRFLAWLRSDDPGPQQVRNDVRRWLEHLRLIVDSCLDGTRRPWDELARENEEHWNQLVELAPVVGVTGGSGGHRRAIRQFRTPSMPRVIVCTDTLKEGVDLHLFCDQVLHYGVAWTAGDMEQRTGRVDRYFSQIERRLSREGRNVQLQVGYPHVVASLERSQVERVVERQKVAEQLMDSPLHGTKDGETEITDDAPAAIPRSFAGDPGPLAKLSFSNKGRSLAVATDAAGTRDHYASWYELLRSRMQACGWQIEPDDGIREHATLVRADRKLGIDWSFDAALERYIITVSSSGSGKDGVFAGGKRWHIVEGKNELQSFARLLVPTPNEGKDEAVIGSLTEALAGTAPKFDGEAQAFWEQSFEGIAHDRVEWPSDHWASLTVARGERRQRIDLDVFAGSVRAVSVVARTLEALGPREDWGGTPSSVGVRDWTRRTNNNLPLGYLEYRDDAGLVFGIHALHGALSSVARQRLIQEVAWRADVWEATLTGRDEH